MAGLLGREVLTKDYETVRVRIAFQPQLEKFEVANPAIRKDGAWIEDVAAVFAPEADLIELPRRRNLWVNCLQAEAEERKRSSLRQVASNERCCSSEAQL